METKGVDSDSYILFTTQFNTSGPESLSWLTPRRWSRAALLTSPSMYFSRQMAQSEVELLLSESEVPQLLSLRPLPLALNFLVSIFSKAWMAILFMELCGDNGGGYAVREGRMHAFNFVKIRRNSPCYFYFSMSI